MLEQGYQTMKSTLTHLGVRVALLGIAVAVPTAVVAFYTSAPAGDPAGLAKSYSPPLDPPCAWGADSAWMCWAGPGGTPLPPPSTVGYLPPVPTTYNVVPGAP